jgi:FkbM family methyltransferase
MFKIKSIFKRLFSLFGLQIRRIPEKDYNTGKFFPYFKKIKIGEIEFDFFIGDTDAAHWYDKWYPNLLQNELLSINSVLALKNPKVIVDIGAHHGFSTVYFAKAFPDAKIVAVEPNPSNFVLLKANIEHNKCKNIITHNVLLSDISGKSESINMDSSNSFVSFQKDASSLALYTTTLDELVTEPIDFIKIDVEGFEHKILLGAKRILEKQKPIMEIEIHPKGLIAYGSSMKEFAKTIEKFNYSKYYQIQETNQIINIEKINTTERTNILIINT